VSDVSRLAVFGDIHGNVEALDAVIAAIRGAGIDRALCTGDVVLRGLSPEECISRVRGTGWPCVGGNTDRRVANKKLKKESDIRGMRPGSRTWTKAILSDDAIAWLHALPELVEADLGPHRVVAIHGDRTVPPGLVDHEASDHQIVAMMDALGADVLAVAHTHKRMIRAIEGRLVINPGSVGEGTADDPRPTWGWLEWRDAAIHAAIEYVEAPLAPPRDRSHKKGE
jgi:putative phosphoesterase